MNHLTRACSRWTIAVATVTVVLGTVTVSADAAGHLSAQTFVTKAGATNLMEIKLGHLAEQQSNNQAVDDFAKRMISDHTRLQKELTQAVSSAQLDVPNKLPAKMQKKYDSMAKLSGATFNRSYARFNVKGHKQAIALYQKEEKSSGNADLRQFASNGLSTIQQHYQLAQQLAKTVKASRSSN